MPRKKASSNRTDSRTPVNVRDLVDALPSTTHYRVPDPLTPRLPLESMPWDDFEKLCAQLVLASETDAKEAFRYGSPQQQQGGMDILVLRRGTNKKLALECKRVAHASPGEIAQWVGRFLARRDLAQFDRFILCVTVRVEIDKHLVEAWYAAAADLDRARIDAELWDLERLQQVLRLHPQVVTRFFGHEVARRFCIQSPSPERPPGALRERYVSEGNHYLLLQNRSVNLNLSLPAPKHPRVAAALDFVRPDLRGMMLTLTGSTFVSMLRWAARELPLEKSPFLTPSHLPGQFLFKMPQAHFSIEARELDDLRWVLREGWRKYIDAAQRLDELWQAARFPMQAHGEFGLYRVEPGFWRAIFAYAHEHQYDEGDSPQHIFDLGGASVQVYTDSARAGLQPGYHLQLHRQSVLDPISVDGRIILSWHAIVPLRSSEVVVYAHDQAWDAEYAHEWLITSLFPAVLSWAQKRNRNATSWFRKLLNPRPPRAIQLEDLVTSMAEAPGAWNALQLRTRADALEAARTLAMHFRGDDCAFLDPDLTQRVLDLVLFLLPDPYRGEHPYFREILSIKGDSLAAGLHAVLADCPGSPTALNTTLDSLIAALEDCPELNPARLDHVSRRVQPLWVRWREDMLCRAYC